MEPDNESYKELLRPLIIERLETEFNIYDPSEEKIDELYNDPDFMSYFEIQEITLKGEDAERIKYLMEKNDNQTDNSELMNFINNAINRLDFSIDIKECNGMIKMEFEYDDVIDSNPDVSPLSVDELKKMYDMEN